MDDFKQRLEQEFKELNDKYTKLESFLGSKKFNELSSTQRVLLVVQKDAMGTYLTCLHERLNNL